MASNLPTFLEPHGHKLPGQPSTDPVKHANALFRHTRFPSLAHVCWWRSQNNGKTCVIFIPGNPGLVDWYTPFLTAIHEKSHESLSILAHGLVGHTPGINTSNQHASATSLHAQVEHIVELIDAVKSQFDRIVLIGHSVGTWIALQALKQREDSVNALFLLFPTITDIANTPNGRRLAHLFSTPIPRIVSWMTPLTYLIPDRLLGLVYSDWPAAQRAVLRSLIGSPSTVYACLSMAREEMQEITVLDEALLLQHTHRLHMYFAEEDGWVGDNKAAILKVFQDDPEAIRIVHGHQDIPHAFCINHGETVAEQCHEWLIAGGFVDQPESSM